MRKGDSTATAAAATTVTAAAAEAATQLHPMRSLF